MYGSTPVYPPKCHIVKWSNVFHMRVATPSEWPRRFPTKIQEIYNVITQQQLNSIVPKKLLGLSYIIRLLYHNFKLIYVLFPKILSFSLKI